MDIDYVLNNYCLFRFSNPSHQKIHEDQPPFWIFIFVLLNFISFFRNAMIDIFYVHFRDKTGSVFI